MTAPLWRWPTTRCGSPHGGRWASKAGRTRGGQLSGPVNRIMSSTGGPLGDAGQVRSDKTRLTFEDKNSGGRGGPRSRDCVKPEPIQRPAGPIKARQPPGGLWPPVAPGGRPSWGPVRPSPRPSPQLAGLQGWVGGAGPPAAHAHLRGAGPAISNGSDMVRIHSCVFLPSAAVIKTLHFHLLSHFSPLPASPAGGTQHGSLVVGRNVPAPPGTWQLLPAAPGLGRTGLLRGQTC